MLQLKKISVNLALVLSLTAFSAVQYAQAENIKLPLSAEDPDIRAVVENIKMNVGPDAAAVQELMKQTRDRMKEAQARRLPLIRPVGDAISQVVSTKVRDEVRTRTRAEQMAAMSDAMNPTGVPNFIAPKFDFE